MVAYRKVAELNQADAAYIAGLIGGEGTVTLTKKQWIVSSRAGKKSEGSTRSVAVLSWTQRAASGHQ